MKLAYSSNGFTQRSLIESIESIARLGYEGVEILADRPHLFPPQVNSPLVRELRETLDRLQIGVSNINANTTMGFFSELPGETTFEPALCNADPDRRKLRLQYTKACIDIAQAIGCRNISITSGMCLPGNPPQHAMRYFIDSLNEVMEYAERKCINIGIEYEPGLLIEKGDELLELMEVIGSKRLGANLDLGHAVVGGEDIGELLHKFVSRIWNIHLEDIHERKHYHLIPGQGTMNMPAIFNELRRIDYQGFVTIELYTYAHDDVNAATQAIQYLQPIVKGEMASEIF